MSSQRPLSTLPTTPFLALLIAVGLQAQGKFIPDSAAGRHVGETVTVEGVIANVHTSRAGNTFLNFGASYPNQVFTAVVFRSSSGPFGDFQRWSGKRARVSGHIQLYQGKPEIILNDPAQLTLSP